MKFNWKSRAFVGSLVTVLLSVGGVSAVYAPFATDAACAAVKCDAA